MDRLTRVIAVLTASLLLSPQVQAKLVKSAADAIYNQGVSMAKQKKELKPLVAECQKCKKQGAVCLNKKKNGCQKLKDTIAQIKADEKGIKDTAQTGTKAADGSKQNSNAMMQALQMLAAMKPQGGNSPMAASSFATEPLQTVAALEGVGLSPGEARSAVQAAIAADKIEKSGLLDGVKGSKGSGGAGASSLASIGAGAGGGTSGGLDGAKGSKVAAIKAAQDKLKKDKKEITSAPISFGSGGGGGADNHGSFGLGEEDDLFSLGTPPDLNGGGESPADKDFHEAHSFLGGEKIGAYGQNVFEKVSRRYQILKKSNRLIVDE